MKKYDIAHLPPKEREIIAPENGWQSHTAYLVHVSYDRTNPIHAAILHVGFVDNGKPGAYSYIWRNSYDGPMDFSEVYYLKVVKELCKLS